MALRATLYFIFPGDPQTRTGGYAYGREIIAAMQRAGVAVATVALPDGFPVPSAEVRRQAGEILDRIPDGASVIFDGLACGALPEEVARLVARTRVVALVHHPLSDESGIQESDAKILFKSEKDSLSYVHHTIVTSNFTARRMRDFGVGEDRLTVIEPGTDPASLAQGSSDGAPVALLAVASVTPRKAYPDLLNALAPLTALEWRLDCVGGLDMDRAHAAAVLDQAAQFGDRVRFHGALPSESLSALYQQADLFVSPSHYEGYGMAIAEAAARGLPILAASGGAVPFTTGGRAALLVEPGDVPALSTALKKLITQEDARTALRERSLAARGALPTWDQSGARCISVMRQVVGEFGS